MSELDSEDDAAAARERERRTQTRIEVQIPVEVIFPGCAEPVKALSQDISWGGTLLAVSEPLPKESGPIRVLYPWKRDERIKIDARLLRAKPMGRGRYLIAVRFVSLSPRSQSRLERLLRMLRPGRRTGADTEQQGLVRELEVTVTDADELRAMLKQIATGRHQVTVFDAYQVNQSISFSIAGPRDLPGIRLRARVAAVEQSKAQGFEWADLYTLTLAFEHPGRSIRSFVRLLLDQLPPAEPTQAAAHHAPDWVRAIPVAQPTGADRDRRMSGVRTYCALELGFPEALVRLTAGWGDVEAFEMLFRDLVLGEQGDPGGWPPDAWEELELLQEVHDRAYGISAARASLLKPGRAN